MTTNTSPSNASFAESGPNANVFDLSHSVTTAGGTAWEEQWQFGIQRDPSGEHRVAFLVQHKPHRKVTDKTAPQPELAIVQAELSPQGISYTSDNWPLVEKMPADVRSAWAGFTLGGVTSILESRKAAYAGHLTPHTGVQTRDLLGNWRPAGGELVVRVKDSVETWRVIPHRTAGKPLSFRVDVESSSGEHLHLHMDEKRQLKIDHAKPRSLALPPEVHQAAYATISALEAGRSVIQQQLKDGPPEDTRGIKVFSREEIRKTGWRAYEENRRAANATLDAQGRGREF